MRAFHEARSHCYRRAIDLLDTEQFKGQATADDIHDGIDRSHLVEMDFFNVDTMDPRLGLAKPFEHGLRVFAGFQGEFAGVDQFEDRAQGSVGFPRRALCCGGMRVRMFMAASVGACVGVFMGMIGSRFMVAGEMIFGENDFQPGALEGSSKNGLSLNRVASEWKQTEGFAEFFDVESRVDKSPKGHVAAAAAERLKIGDSSHLAVAGNLSGSEGVYFLL